MIAACLAFRNSARYLREWLLFHRAVGIERFYLYDNDSTDDFRTALSPFLGAETPAGPQVELISWPGYFQQNAIYDDCLRRAAPRDEWVAFIDDDEFLMSSTGEPLPRVLERFATTAVVAVCWQLYGSSGQLYAGAQPVVQRFTRRAVAPDQHVKCIVHAGRVRRAIAGGHHFEPREGFQVVDELGRPLNAPLTPTPSAALLRVNHYLMKSVEEMIERRTSRDIGYGDKQKLTLLEWLRNDRGWNAVEDAHAAAMLPAMRRDAERLGIAFP